MSKECDEALASLYKYLDAELDSASTARIKDHLDDCPGCMRPFDFESRLRMVVKDRLDEEVPDAFVARLHAALDEERGH